MRWSLKEVVWTKSLSFAVFLSAQSFWFWKHSSEDLRFLLAAYVPLWHFPLHDSSPCTVVTVFRQNLSRAGERMYKRTSEGKGYHFLRSGWEIICLSGENKPVGNLSAYLGHWHDVKCWHRIGPPWEPEWLTVLTSLDIPMVEGTRLSQPEQKHREEEIAALEQTGTNLSLLFLCLFFFL